MLHVRKATASDFERIMEIYHHAREFMIKTGNPNQWGRIFPTREMIVDDLNNGRSHVIYDEAGIHGVFALFTGEDPTYSYIEGGKWLNNEPYVTIHRIAGDGKVRGIFKTAADYCKSISRNVRVDTHADNKIMQRAVEKERFVKCGIIYVRDHSPRIAYQWTKMKDGEQAAKMILQNEGIVFDEGYYDDNSESKMPDFKEKDGKYWEVTHTNHNNSIPNKMNRFHKKNTVDKCKIINAAYESFERIRIKNYPQESGKLTPEGQKQFAFDAKNIKEHYGIDIKNKSQYSEFKCDNPIIEMSVDNIIDAINRKAELHPQNDTNLFVFISQEENELLVDLLESNKNNGYYISFMNCILNSPFDIVYLCVWDFYKQNYDYSNPILHKFVTLPDQEAGAASSSNCIHYTCKKRQNTEYSK